MADDLGSQQQDSFWRREASVCGSCAVGIFAGHVHSAGGCAAGGILLPRAQRGAQTQEAGHVRDRGRPRLRGVLVPEIVKTKMICFFFHFFWVQGIGGTAGANFCRHSCFYRIRATF